MAMLSQRHIRDYIFADIAEAQQGGRSYEVCYVKSTRTHYEYIEDGGGLVVNGTSILSTVNGGNTRWLAISGQYEMNKFAVPLTEVAQNTVFTGQELPELVFDVNGNVMMHLVDGGSI